MRAPGTFLGGRPGGGGAWKDWGAGRGVGVVPTGGTVWGRGRGRPALLGTGAGLGGEVLGVRGA